MIVLLDANVLIAPALADHVHHDVAEELFTGSRSRFATCPVTQGALLRLVLRSGGTAAQGQAVLDGLTAHRRHRFRPDGIGFAQVELAGVVGHRQVTDAYLAALARHNRGRIATLDGGLAALHPDVADLIEA